MKILWTDLETTGLDPLTKQVLEVYVAVADFHDPFNARELYHAVLPLAPTPHIDLSQDIVEMHTKNGLFADCASWSTKRRELVDIELSKKIDSVEEHGVFPVLGGSSIHFDWNFIMIHLPRVAMRMSHRPGDVQRYDVSVLKRFCESWGMEPLPKASAHRAKEDVWASIAVGKACDEWLLKRT
jgi:oligoribonuclease (3'-5' exoribonuclease)